MTSAQLAREASNSDAISFRSGSINQLSDGSIIRGSRDVTKLTLRHNQVVVLTTRSKTMDTYLEIYRTEGDQGPILADDDSGGGTDSQLRVALAPEQASGSFYIVVTSKSGAGDFQLEARKRDIKDKPPVSLHYGQSMSGKLDEEAPARASDGLLFNSFTFVGAHTDRAAISLTSTSPASGRTIELRLNDRVLGRSDDTLRPGALLVRSLPQDGVYRVDVLGDLNALGSYTIKVDQLPPARAAPAPTPLVVGNSVQGLLSLESPVVSDQSNIPYDLYAVTGDANQRFRVTARSLSETDPAAGRSGLQIQVGTLTPAGFATVASTADASRPVIFAFRSAGTVMVRVLGPVGQQSSYTLRVDPVPPSP